MNPAGPDTRKTIVYIGTHKLAALQVSLDGQEPLVLRSSVLPDPEGFEKGLVSNLQKASSSIESVISKLYERGQARPANFSCCVVLGNSKLKTYSYSSSLYYQGVQRTIAAEDMRQVIRQTRTVATLPLTEFVLQAIPETYIVNDMKGVKNPVGLEAHRLGVELKIHTMHFQDFKNISKAFEAAEIDVECYFPKSVAVSEAVLNDQEKNEGAVVIDIADDVTSLALWKDGSLIDTRVISCGGSVLSGEVAAAWGIEVRDARKIKEKFGTYETVVGDELIPIVDRTADGSHQVRRQEFQEKFLEQSKKWLQNILSQADAFAKEKHVLHPHYVYTGGAVSLQGFLEFLQKSFSRTGRLGLARQVDAPRELLVDPSMSAALGMVKWYSAYEREQRQYFAPRGIVEKTIASAKDFLTAYF